MNACTQGPTPGAPSSVWQGQGGAAGCAPLAPFCDLVPFKEGGPAAARPMQTPPEAPGSEYLWFGHALEREGDSHTGLSLRRSPRPSQGSRSWGVTAMAVLGMAGVGAHWLCPRSVLGTFREDSHVT